MLPPTHLPSRHDRLRVRVVIVMWTLVGAILTVVMSGGTARAGTGTACSSTQPQASVRAISAAMTGDSLSHDTSTADTAAFSQFSIS